MYWELWDIESKNLVETFDTEDEALQGVRDILAVNRPDLIDDLVLGAMYDEDEPHEIPLPPVLTAVELRSRLADSAPAFAAADAARAVHQQIRGWLTEEGCQLQEIPNPESRFYLAVKLQGGQGIRMLQSVTDLDHIVIAQPVLLAADSQSALAQIAPTQLNDLVWGLRRDATIVGVDLEGLEPPLQALWHLTTIYFDALTKDALFQRIMLVVRAAALSAHTLARGLEQAERPTAAAALRQLAPDTKTSSLISAAS